MSKSMISNVSNDVNREQYEIDPVDTGKKENIPPLLIPVYIYDIFNL